MELEPTRRVASWYHNNTTHRPTEATSSLIPLIICQSCDPAPAWEGTSYGAFDHHYRQTHHRQRRRDTQVQLIYWDDLETAEYECKICQTTFSERRSWWRHQRHFHPDIPSRIEDCLQYKTGFKFECPVDSCGWLFKRYGSCLYHFERFHPGAEWYEPLYQYHADTPGDPALRLQPAQTATSVTATAIAADAAVAAADPTLFDPAPIIGPPPVDPESADPDLFDPAWFLSLNSEPTMEMPEAPPIISPRSVISLEFVPRKEYPTWLKYD